MTTCASALQGPAHPDGASDDLGHGMTTDAQQLADAHLLRNWDSFPFAATLLSWPHDVMLWTYHVNPIVRTPEESPELESREVEQISAVAPKARLLSVNKDQIAASDFEQVPSCLNGQERCACRSVKAQPGFQQIPTK
jgi:hypothetical protein